MGALKSVALVALTISLSSLHHLRADPKTDPIEVTYLGNEGFLVRSGSQVVLFDALFGAGLPDYDRVPESVVNDIETARPPFAKINVIFISHAHPDHFDLPSTVRFLKSHPTTVVVAPVEISQQLQNALANNRRMLSQIRTVSAEAGRITTSLQGSIQIGIFPLTHRNVENLAYLVLLNGRAVLHLGDADIPMRNLAQLKLINHRIDVAFIPFWQLTRPRSVRDQISAKVVVPMHVITHATASSKEYLDHVGGPGGMLAKIRSEFPNAASSGPLETKTF